MVGLKRLAKKCINNTIFMALWPTIGEGVNKKNSKNIRYVSELPPPIFLFFSIDAFPNTYYIHIVNAERDKNIEYKYNNKVIIFPNNLFIK